MGRPRGANPLGVLCRGPRTLTVRAPHGCTVVLAVAGGRWATVPASLPDGGAHRLFTERGYVREHAHDLHERRHSPADLADVLSRRASRLSLRTFPRSRQTQRAAPRPALRTPHPDTATCIAICCEAFPGTGRRATHGSPRHKPRSPRHTRLADRQASSARERDFASDWNHMSRASATSIEPPATRIGQPFAF